jgi:radical SAM protein with 4Fe4S-binding SPASM domain
MIPWNTPAVVALELTLRCPCRCITCGSRAGAPRPRELEHREWLDAIAALVDLGCQRISLMGGEPLLYPRWSELAFAARKRGLIVDMISSGQGLDQDTALRMCDSGLHAVTISIDGLTATHDRQRGLPDCFAQALKAIRLVDQAGLKVGVTTQVNRGNLAELEALAPVLEDAGVLGWQLQMTLPIGRAETQQLALSPEEMPELLRVLRRLARRPGLRPHLTDNIGYCTHDDQALRTIQGGFPRPWLGCRAGLDALGVTSDGRVKGCLSLPDSCVEGNIREQSLASIWNSPDRFAYNRRFSPAQVGGDCITCPHVARCRGGCSATAYATSGRPSESVLCLWLHDGIG